MENNQKYFFLTRLLDDERKMTDDCQIEVSEYINVVLELVKAKRKLKEWDESLQYIDKILDLDNKNAEVWNLKGIVCSEIKREEVAEEAFQKALEITNDNYSTLVNLGIVQRRLKKWEESERSFNKAIALDSENYIAWNEKGMLFCEQKRWDSALGCFALAEKGSRSNKTINAIQWSALGYVLKWKNKLNDSLVCYKQAVEKDPQKPQYYNSLGEIELRLHKFDESKSSFKKAIQLDPNYAPAWNGLGNIYENLNDLDHALKSYEESLRLDPENEMYKEDVLIVKEHLNAGKRS